MDDKRITTGAGQNVSYLRASGGGLYRLRWDPIDRLWIVLTAPASEIDVPAVFKAKEIETNGRVTFSETKNGEPQIEARGIACLNGVTNVLNIVDGGKNG